MQLLRSDTILSRQYKAYCCYVSGQPRSIPCTEASASSLQAQPFISPWQLGYMLQVSDKISPGRCSIAIDLTETIDACYGDNAVQLVICDFPTFNVTQSISWHLNIYSIGLAEGIMPLGLNDALALPVQSEGDDGGSGCEPDSPQETKVYVKLCEIMICATETLKRVHSGSDSKSSSSLLSCISLFDTQLSKAALQVQTTVGENHRFSLIMKSAVWPPRKLDSIYYQCYRLYLLAYHFLIAAAFRKLEGFISLYAVACNLVNTVCQRSAVDENVAKIAPAFIHKTMMLAACTILKIHRSELAPHLDLEAGEQAYFASIVFAREGSLQSNDLSARGATIFSQLWNSQKIFRGKDGRIDSLSSRISSRLSTSIVFDCLWWWRQEFGGSGNPYESRRQSKLVFYFSLIWSSESK